MTARDRRVAFLVAACFFMEMLDGTIVTTSAPKIADSLGVPASSIGLIITVYVVTLAALIPLSGWMSARFGARRVFLAAIVIFTVASLGCAASTSLAELVAMRVLQGVGGAMMVPVGRLVVLARAPKSELMRAIAYLIWPALLAPVIAPLAGGLITTYASWHWLFLINVPLGAIAFSVALRLIRPPAQDRPPRLDVIGVLLTGAGLAGLTVTTALLAHAHLNVVLDLSVGISAVALLALAVRHLLRTRDPLIELRTLRIHTFRSALGGMSIYFTVIGAVPFLLPLLFQEVFGWSAVKSGALILFVFAGNIAIKPATTFLFSRFGFRPMLVGTTSVMALTMFAVALTTAATPVALIAVVLTISGIARSIGGTGYSTIAFSEVPEAEMRHANTLQATVQQLSAGFGVAGGAIALRLGEPVGRLFSDDPGARAPYVVAFLVLGTMSLIAGVGATRLRPGAGDVLRRERTRPADRRTPAAVAAPSPSPAAEAAPTESVTTSSRAGA